MSKAWIFLFLAAIFETGWTYALKYMSFSSLKIAWSTKDNLYEALLPFIAYIFLVEGIFIVYLSH